FNNFRPPEQATFRKGFSTVDHVHTPRQIIQEIEEYNLPLYLVFVHHKKDFDTIDTWAVLQSLQRCLVDTGTKAFVLLDGSNLVQDVIELEQHNDMSDGYGQCSRNERHRYRC
ncbi:hypothetical protein evm_008696, partial [Chilo suppressalis]